MKDISDRESNSFWAIKALAIFTVFFAHMPGHGFYAPIFDRIGLIGVPLFMICAGYFNNSRCGKFIEWIGKKWKSVFIPWLIWGTITYVIHILKSHDLSLVTYLKWIVGIGTWLYFVPVLLCCQLMSRYCNKYVLLALGLVSMFLSSFHWIPYDDVFTPYVNPFNFLAYFSVGIIVRDYSFLLNRNSLRGGGLIIIIISITLIVIFKPVYWYPYSLVISFALFLGLYFLFCAINHKFLINIGKISFVIYLSHIQIAGAVNKALSPLWGTTFEFVKVIIAFVVAALFVFGLRALLRILKLDTIERLLGFR